VQIDAQLRYCLHLDPDALTDEEWAANIVALKRIREEESKKL
jgi:hypothetical protein